MAIPKDPIKAEEWRRKIKTTWLKKYPPKPMNRCGCGCGGLTRWNYCSGHFSRMIPKKKIIMNSCACGCNQPCKKKFVHGHNSKLNNPMKGKGYLLKGRKKNKVTEETKQKCRKTWKKKFAEGYVHFMRKPETKERYSKIMSGPNSPNYKGGKAIYLRKQKAKRRSLGHIFLNEPFEDCRGHHIDCEHILYIPKELHKSTWHALKFPETMIRINIAAWIWFIFDSGQIHLNTY